MSTFPTPVPWVAASLLFGLAAELRAEPVDPFDPTPRQVQVEIEVSPHPQDYGLSWSAPLLGTFSYTSFLGPDFAQITVPGAVYEDFLEAYGLPGGLTLIPGTVTDFIILISRTTFDVIAGGECIFNPGFSPNGRLVRDLNTFGPHGYFQFSGMGEYHWCAEPLPGLTCFPVSDSPYDLQTGLVNAPGRDRLIHSDVGPDFMGFFAEHGEMRLSEVAPAVPVLPSGWWLALYGFVFAAVLRGSKKPGASVRWRSQMRWRG